MTHARRKAAHASLWLQEDTTPRRLALRSRFRHYPHFEAVLDEYVDLKVPPMVLVRWVPLAHISESIPVHSSEEAARERAFLRDVARRMKAGDDIPPVLLRDGRIHDGRHRTLAAKMLGLRLVPVVDTDAFWHETPVEEAAPAPAAPSTGYRWPHALAPREGNPRTAVPPEIATLLPELVRVAQAQYDAWQQDEEGFDEEYGEGGICHLIAEDMSAVLAGKALACTTVSSMQEVHVYVVVKLPSGVWRVDIEPHVYETGAAYTWKKRSDVTLTEDDVTVERLSASPGDFRDFVEDGWDASDDESDDGRHENPVRKRRRPKQIDGVRLETVPIRTISSRMHAIGIVPFADAFRAAHAAGLPWPEGMPPIVVTDAGLLIDGAHRMMSARAAGYDAVLAVVVPQWTWDRWEENLDEETLRVEGYDFDGYMSWLADRSAVFAQAVYGA